MRELNQPSPVGNRIKEVWKAEMACVLAISFLRNKVRNGLAQSQAIYSCSSQDLCYINLPILTYVDVLKGDILSEGVLLLSI